MAVSDRVTIFLRVTALAALPSLAALGLGGYLLADQAHRLAAAEHTASRVNLAPGVGDLIHQIQIERGLTATVLKAPGDAAVSARRREQFVKVDRAAEALRGEIAAQGGDATSWRGLAEALARLPDIRARIDAHRLSAPEAIGFFNGLIEQALAPVENLAGAADEGATARALGGFVALLRGKELSGQERAAGAAALAGGALDPASYRRFVALGASQAEELGLAQRLGVVGLENFSASPEQQGVAALRDAVEAAALRGGAAPAASAWFEAATQRIDALKRLEDAAAVALKQAVDAQTAQARAALIVGGASLAALFALIGLASWRIARSISRPLQALSRTIEALTRGELRGDDLAQERGRGDEIGVLARSVESFRDALRARDALEEGARQSRALELRRQNKLRAEIEAFRARAGAVAARLVDQARTMGSAADQLTRAHGAAARAGEEARGAARGYSADVETVSAAAVELSASFAEVNRQMGDACARAAQAADSALTAEARVAGLKEMAERIGSVVAAIRAISAQTNLLALNATIESARAGEAGRGFAVVAAEVKTLATQAAAATDEIAAEILAVQQAVQATVEDIGRIASGVQDIDKLTGSVSTSVEQQAAATSEIAQAIASASQGSARSADAVGDIAGAIEQTGGDTERVAAVAAALTADSEHLTQSVAEFLSAMAQDVDERRLAVRRASTQVAILHSGGERFLARLVDISETGAKIIAPDSLRRGDRVSLAFEDQSTLDGEVAWSEKGCAGIKFAAPLSQAQVVGLAGNATRAA